MKAGTTLFPAPHSTVWMGLP